MPHRWTCPQGHEWDASPEESAAGACPVCGAQVVRAAPVTVEFASDTAGAGNSGTGAVVPPGRGATWPVVRGYEILAEMGRGGMGVVYKARQLSLQRLVALKMIQAGSASSHAARFRLEAEAVAQLQHPNIVQIYEIGDTDGQSFFALELVEGGTLSGRLRQGALPPLEAARLVETLARAVHHAHERGIVHRDLKPANVLLLPDGTPKIADFGLAKRLEGPGVTLSGSAILGTPSYMAPEQAEGRTNQVTRSVDVYALGATLYELLTGRPPFRADTPLNTVLKVVHEEPPPPSGVRAGIPRDLETICLKCLRKQPGERYASADALADDLRRFAQGESITARPPRAWERWRYWLRRHREAVAIAFGALGLLALLMVALRPFGPPPPEPPTPGKPNPVNPKAQPLALPAELALVPRDAFAFVSVAVGDILGREGLVELYEEISRLVPGAPTPNQIAAEMERQVGVAPKGIARVVLVKLDAEARRPKETVSKKWYFSPGLSREVVIAAAAQPFFLSPGAVTRAWLGHVHAQAQGALENLWFVGPDVPNDVVIVATAQPYDRDKIMEGYTKGASRHAHLGKEYLVSPRRGNMALWFASERIFVVAENASRMK